VLIEIIYTVFALATS